ncbi:MAG: protein translocase subunit SecD, partial [Burkholderiaceae bacterium]
MNRYPLWKYIVIVVALLIGATYMLPNFFGESPAVQVSSAKSTVKIDPSLMTRVEDVLKDAKIAHDGFYFDTAGLNSTIRVRFRDADTQLAAKDTIQKALDPSQEDPAYVVALNLVSNTPRWLTSLHALPMYLGLDLRGGVHFLMQVDMRAAVDKRLDTLASDIRTLLREKNIRHAGINKTPAAIEIRFRDADTRARAEDEIRGQVRELTLREEGSGDNLSIVATLSPAAQKEIQDNALKQNITT